MTLIVDASVAVKWVAEEPDSDRAQTFFAEADDLVAPTLILAEVGSALWKKYRMKAVSAPQVRQALDGLPRYIDRLYVLPDLAMPALDLAIRLGHPIYDCFYLALAQREDAPLVTADDRLAAAARKAGIETRRLQDL